MIDPTRSLDAIGDVWVANGKIVNAPADTSIRADREIDVRGDIVMAGAIDLHTHIAGPKVNAGRRRFPEFHRGGQSLTAPEFAPPPGWRRSHRSIVPTTFATGYLYAGMGYTTAFDAAIPGLLARHAHAELADTPVIDKGFYLLVGNNHFIMEQLREGSRDAVEEYCAWALKATKAYALKIVNPGGIENWKHISRKTLHELDEPVAGWGISPRQIVATLAATADRLRLPHPIHIHCNNLGMPGNVETTLRTMDAVGDHRAHFAHVQFHSYARLGDDPLAFGSAVLRLVEYLRDRPNLSVDIGHVLPGRTASMTGDAPFSHYLHELTHQRFFAADSEQESSCGVIPLEYRPQKSLIHALQWAIALEWYLLMDDPWRLAMTSDHPNGSAFYRYPELIELLMDASARREWLKQMPEKIRERTILADLTREYTLAEIAIITRAAPARLVGLNHKGHLTPGADADITVYTPHDRPQIMFSLPRYVFKKGELAVERGAIRSTLPGHTFHCDTETTAAFRERLKPWFSQRYSLTFEQYELQESETQQLQPNRLST